MSKRNKATYQSPNNTQSEFEAPTKKDIGEQNTQASSALSQNAAIERAALRPDLNGKMEEAADIQLGGLDSSGVPEDLNQHTRHLAFKEMLGLQPEDRTISKASPAKAI